ncbi:tRNA (adenosine(37)-N6)-threonylcarbamoyltransferase complex transferase subunit TsaD [Candidatus Dependentiae bacterium]|nr:tRNA (adenosine(37)-N6)-threonylcarbamoyltransferase complex transferase subunit TsaD [Candidatus Dependentiae bacterium]
MYILGIETSCDETAAAVYHTNLGMLSNVLFSQIKLHAPFGGVIPEIASRAHVEKINGVVSHALKKANVTLETIDTIAVTHKPGLPGALLIGTCFAKSLAWAQHKKLIGINHLEGHIFSACIENNVPFPFICLTASGGHTAMYLVHDFGKYEVIGETIDDAAGEAFDKVAKLVGLPYPGGPIIEKLAQEVGFVDFFNYPRPQKKTLSFSFSGLKTAVLYDLVKRGAYELKSKTFLQENDDVLKKQVASSLIVCIADIFQEKLLLAIKKYPAIKSICFVGGVACNNYIKKQFADFAHKHNKQLFTPSRQYCTDNGAMIAFVGGYKAQKGNFSTFDLDILE